MRRLASAGLILLILLARTASAAVPIDDAIRDVERIRGLRFAEKVRTASISRSLLKVALREQISRALPYSFDDYLLILTSLRLVEPGTKNADDLLLDLMEQQVLAFYDPLSHTYYAIDEPPAGIPEAAKMMGFEHAVAVHELTHALQDQTFHIGPTDLALRKDTDASLAFHSLIEGDASLVMMGPMVEPLGLTIEGIVKSSTIANLMANAATMIKASEGTPRYFMESLALPYSAGLRFIMDAYRRGGWDAVNRLYADPPASMREVLHPDEYFGGRRSPNPYSLDPPLPVSHLLTVEHLGEWHWQFLLGAEAARGWKGDRVTIAQDWFCRPTVLVESKWESADRARSFSKSYAAFLQRNGIEAEVRASGTSVRVAYGADPVLIERFMKIDD